MDRAEQCQQRLDELYRYTKPTLKELVSRHYQVIDLRDPIDKGTLVSYVLQAEFGKNYYEKYLEAET